jgi:hypothetical protein
MPIEPPIRPLNSRHRLGASAIDAKLVANLRVQSTTYTMTSYAVNVKNFAGGRS